MAEVFTLTDFGAVEPVVSAAIHCSHVKRLVDGRVIEGTARMIGTDTGCRANRDTDVRALFLRVTTDAGWELFWPVRELMRDATEGLFVIG